MKNKIIRINDISEIDTSKISVYDLNNRYIDPSGDMYGLKYNQSMKKIEIIKIVRAHTDDASFIHQQLIKKKIDTSKEISGDERIDEDIEIENKLDQAKTEDPENKTQNYFNPNTFINDSISLMLTHKERFKGIIMNIKNSNAFPKENRSESIELENIFRNIEIDIIQQFEILLNYQKELTNYPRSITYYQAKIDDQGRDIIEALSGDNIKIMRFIYLYEMYCAIVSLYRNVLNITKQLMDYVSQKRVDELKSITITEKQYYKDAETSISNTIEDSERLLDNIVTLENYVTTPSNL